MGFTRTTPEAKAASEKTGSPLVDELHLTCTRENNRVCQLLRRLTECNEILWHAGLQLEDYAQGGLGDVSIAMVPVLCRGFPCCRSSEDDEKSAVRLVRRLLTAHRCIVSVEVNYCVAKHSRLLEALASSTSARRLGIFGIPSNEPEVLQALVEAITHMDAVSQLVFLDGYEPCEAKMAIPVLALQRPNAAITKLDVADLEMDQHTSRLLIEALQAKNTVEELAVGACVFALGPVNRPSEWFAQYLAKATLRKLVLKARHFNNTFGLQRLVETISAMTTLRELIAQWQARSRDCTLFGNVVRENRSLRSLSLLLGGCCNAPIPQYRDRATEAVNVRPWLLALRDNDVLQKLVLDVPWSGTDDCLDLLRELPSNHCLEKLVLSSIPDDGGLHEVCRVIRECDVRDRVRIKDHHVGPNDVATLSTCSEVTAVTVSTKHFFCDVARLPATFEVLATCKNVTSLRVRFHFFNKGIYASLTSYLKGNSTLNEIDLVVEVDDICDEKYGSIINSSMLDLFEGLSSNHAITKITLEWNVLLADDHARLLAHGVLNNRRLYELSLRAVDEAFCAAILDHVYPSLAQNYSLIRLGLPTCTERSAQIAAAQDIVRRNRSLVDRGTRFVLGDHDPYCARAVELVSRHPKLVKNVRREAKMSSEGEALAKIASALRLPCLTDIHEFMKLTGVVKERVVCNAQQDGRWQLDKLYHDCWLHVRQYLKVADVVER
ncbi:hypothetical protein HPB52_021812 [Rhipicephalus sanguineus]|uniref:Uncharacterized protein n=1 Tax=Rhipicephalus sanguineus TaxID=34632 RepID=A0A9D4PLU8_RHISA|nr:hypothetical protein HPB52_021812 [Rhipicephalus sanguineus]